MVTVEGRAKERGNETGHGRYGRHTPRATVVECRSTCLERQPYARTQLVAILRLPLLDHTVRAGVGRGGCRDSVCSDRHHAFSSVQRTTRKQVAASKSEGGVRGE